MATKEDILEQIAEEYYTHLGYFVRHNVKYLPPKDHPNFEKSKDANHSDIDVLAFHPLKKGPSRVVAVTCKSWQNGFSPTAKLNDIKMKKKVSGKPAWKGFRELVEPKWSKGFRETIKRLTGSEEFTYVVAVARVVGKNEDRELWEKHEVFIENLNGNPIRIIGFDEMVREISEGTTKTLAGTEVGRMLQLFKASKII
jgi:hypothetical protein